VDADPGALSADVSWTAPTDSGTGDITGYVAVASPGGKSCSALAPSTTCSIGKLTAGTSYTVTVYATNVYGAGPESSPSASVVPQVTAPPTAPSQVSAAASTTSTTSAQIDWVASKPRSALVQYYTATSSPGGLTCQAQSDEGGGQDYGCTITGLTAATEYTFSVTATSSVGTSNAGVSNAVTPGQTPPIPTITQITSTNVDTTEVFWSSDPTYNGPLVTTRIYDPGFQSTLCQTGANGGNSCDFNPNDYPNFSCQLYPNLTIVAISTNISGVSTQSDPYNVCP
jgi:hypothetical protein